MGSPRSGRTRLHPPCGEHVLDPDNEHRLRDGRGRSGGPAGRADAALGAAVDTVRNEGLLDDVEVDTVAVEGHAGERLISMSENAQQLVVGSRGHGGFMGLLLGSVTTYVVNHARCPVTVVRPSQD
ncbi:MAG: universal stress protein [Microthrixaceae bacterium]